MSENIPLTEFKHVDAKVWSGEFFGHAVTIARLKGQTQFQAWIDSRLIAQASSYQDAETQAIHWCAHG